MENKNSTVGNSLKKSILCHNTTFDLKDCFNGFLRSVELPEIRNQPKYGKGFIVARSFLRGFFWI